MKEYFELQEKSIAYLQKKAPQNIINLSSETLKFKSR
jgi:hypothetical protein